VAVRLLVTLGKMQSLQMRRADREIQRMAQW
jgi:hypothetical protein